MIQLYYNMHEFWALRSFLAGVLYGLVLQGATSLLAGISTSLMDVACDTPQALEKYNIEKDIAAYIKKEFDKKFSPTWHCIVGRNFGKQVRFGGVEFWAYQGVELNCTRDTHYR